MSLWHLWSVRRLLGHRHLRLRLWLEVVELLVGGDFGWTRLTCVMNIWKTDSAKAVPVAVIVGSTVSPTQVVLLTRRWREAGLWACCFHGHLLNEVSLKVVFQKRFATIFSSGSDVYISSERVLLWQESRRRHIIASPHSCTSSWSDNTDTTADTSLVFGSTSISSLWEVRVRSIVRALSVDVILRRLSASSWWVSWWASCRWLARKWPQSLGLHRRHLYWRSLTWSTWNSDWAMLASSA